MTLKIVIDDLRCQPAGWLLFKSAEDFLAWRKTNTQAIDCLSLDHDLGEQLLSGYDLVKQLLTDKYASNNINKIQLHTDNNIGFKNMYYYLINAQKHSLLPKTTVISSEKLSLIDGNFSYSNYKFV